MCFLPSIPSVLRDPPFQASPWLYPHHKIWLERLIHTTYSLNFSQVFSCCWKCFHCPHSHCGCLVLPLLFYCTGKKQVREDFTDRLHYMQKCLEISYNSLLLKIFSCVAQKHPISSCTRTWIKSVKHLQRNVHAVSFLKKFFDILTKCE